MRIQTRLFVATAVLVLALMGLQWWLYARELRSIEDDLTRVATTVGKGILTEDFFGPLPTPVADGREGQAQGLPRQVVVVDEVEKVGDTERRRIRREVRSPEDASSSHEFEWITEDGGAATADAAQLDDDEAVPSSGPVLPSGARRIVIKVEEGERRDDRFLVVSADDESLRRIPIPVSPTVRRLHETMRKGAVIGGGLLVAGLVASAVLARRVSSPLRDLTEHAGALGRGELGVQVPVSAGGEIGELQGAFNDMSRRLAQLESERELWQRREHLAQLGDLSRGLAHTLRNPLHTLGLAVEELADTSSARSDLVATSRAQILRIDRWLRSFLALGAGDSTAPEPLDLRRVVEDVVFESVQRGADVVLVAESGHSPVVGVEPALRAAIANLVENATEVSPTDTCVEVSLAHAEKHAVLGIADHGPGLPAEVRERLFNPHVTTKAGGAGMGLFLARQLLVGMHGGALEVADREGGGTVVTVRLPLAAEGGDDGGDPRV